MVQWFIGSLDHYSPSGNGISSITSGAEVTSVTKNLIGSLVHAEGIPLGESPLSETDEKIPA